MPYYIIESATRGVLKDLDETDSGKRGRFSSEGLRTEGMRFVSIDAAISARARVTAPSKSPLQIRSSEPIKEKGMRFETHWPVVG